MKFGRHFLNLVSTVHSGSVESEPHLFFRDLKSFLVCVLQSRIVFITLFHITNVVLLSKSHTVYLLAFVQSLSPFWSLLLHFDFQVHINRPFTQRLGYYLIDILLLLSSPIWFAFGIPSAGRQSGLDFITRTSMLLATSFTFGLFTSRRVIATTPRFLR